LAVRNEEDKGEGELIGEVKEGRLPWNVSAKSDASGYDCWQIKYDSQKRQTYFTSIALDCPKWSRLWHNAATRRENISRSSKYFAMFPRYRDKTTKHRSLKSPSLSV